MVVALAPTYRPETRGPATVRVAMTPSPERCVSFLAAAGVHRLLVVRASVPDADFKRRAAAAGTEPGVAIEDHILSSPDALPGRLRAVGARADGIWLAPDPDAVTPETFHVVLDFAGARKIPFFAPAAGLVSGDARGELTVSFHDCGREAARAAKSLLSGRLETKTVYPAPPAEREPLARNRRQVGGGPE